MIDVFYLQVLCYIPAAVKDHLVLQLLQDNASEQEQKKERSKPLPTAAKILEADGIAEHTNGTICTQEHKGLGTKHVMNSATEGSGHCCQELTQHFRA